WVCEWAVAPGRREHLLDELRVLRDLEELLRRQRDVQRARAGARQELLGLVDVLGPLWHVRRRGRAGIDRRERVVVPQVGPPVEEPLDEARAVERVGDGLAGSPPVGRA